MRKAISLLFTILCLSCMLFLIEYKISIKAEPITLYVDDNNVTGPWYGNQEYPYQNITNALKNATDGYTIFVRSGTYIENVIINKSVSLIGENQNLTIIHGNHTGSVISITNVNNININGFTIQYSGNDFVRDSGVYLTNSHGNSISYNTITKNYNGIALYSSNDNVFSDNTIFSNNYYGIALRYSSNNVVSSNTVSNNSNGIGLDFSSNNLVSDNIITSNYNGIILYSSSGNVFSGNTISLNNKNGVTLWSSINNVFSGNTISSNEEYDLFFVSSSHDNTVYCNNFNAHTDVYQVLDSTNVWDDGNKGNYWSNYTGQDLNEDGIGDTPYFIDVNSQDNYPLMGTFSDFKVTLEGRTHHVTTICNSTISKFKFEIGLETGSKIFRFNITDKDNVGFCRIAIPAILMNYPYIVQVDMEEIVPTLLNVSNEAFIYLYFTYIHKNDATIAIVSSKLLYFYNELLGKHAKIQLDLDTLNATYYDLLNNYGILLGNYSQLQNDHQALNDSYQEHLFGYSENEQNIRNLIYIFIATTAIFIITTFYLSKHSNKRIEMRSKPL